MSSGPALFASPTQYTTTESRRFAWRITLSPKSLDGVLFCYCLWVAWRCFCYCHSRMFSTNSAFGLLQSIQLAEWIYRVSFRWFITNASGKRIINCRMCLNFVSNSIHMAQDSFPQFFTLAWEFLLLIWSDLIWADWEYLKCCHKAFEWLSSYLSILFKLTQINHFHYQCVYFCIIFFAVYPQKQPPYPYGHGGYPQMYPIHNMYHGSQYGPYNY